MKKILLVYPPFCTAVTPPYSITYLHSFLKNNLDKSYEIEALDLNLEYHKRKYLKFRKYFQGFNKNYSREEYERVTEEFRQKTKEDYIRSNLDVVNGKKPDLFDAMLSIIIKKKPEIVAFSIVYSSQPFFAYSLIKELKKLGIKTVIGGPCVNKKLREIADAALEDEHELLNYLGHQKDKKINDKKVLDFGIYGLDEYFTPIPVIPIKTSSTCYYKKCAFCTHHSKTDYVEYPLEDVRETINKSGSKLFFIIDDMIQKRRLLEISKIMKEFGARWMCQIKPTDEYDKKTLKILSENGLKAIMWGVESGSDRILKLMKKQTNKKDIAKVLLNSKKAGITNIVYIIFGFPTETDEEFVETVDFITTNKDNIGLVSASLFGLQKGSDIYLHPEKYGIKKITEEKRTILDEKITYETISGLDMAKTRKLRRIYAKRLEKINKFPKTMNFFREHMLIML